MTCKDCLHRPVCVLRTHWGVGSDWNNRYTPDVEKRCKEFKSTEDVVKVKCKDCKYWMKDFAGCTDNVGRCKWANYMVGANGFCAYGEKKEGAEQ